MHSQNDGSKYRPDEGFQQDILDNVSEPGFECEYVPSGYATPDYRILGPDQREYYFYWRSELRAGRCLHTDDGYVWLRLCEIANTESDYGSTLEELMLLHRSCGYLRIRDLIKSVTIDYAIANGRDIPRIWVWGWDERRYMALSEVMASPPDEMELDFMTRLAGNPEVYWEDGDELARLMNLTLLRIDRHLVMTTGKGVEETYGREVRSDHTVYRGLQYFGDTADYSISYISLDGAEFGKFMLGLLRYCEQILFKEQGIRGPSAPSAFGTQFRKIADLALLDMRDGKATDIRGPKPFRGTVRTAVSAKEKMLIEMGRELGVEDPFSDLDTRNDRKGRMLVDLESRVQQVSRTLRFDMDLNKDAKPEYEYPYVPSGYQNPDYRSFDDGQKGFYLSWREKVRNGEYPDTDSGYVWLYLCELINSESDPEDVLKRIGDLGEAYEEDDDSHPLIRTTYYEYAAVNGISKVDPAVYRSPVTMSMAFTSMLDGDLETITDMCTLMELANLREGSMKDDFDSDCAGILCNVLKRIDRSITGRDGILEESMVYPKTVRIRPFTRLKYYRSDVSVKGMNVDFWDFRGSERFVRSMNSVTKNVIRAVRRHNGRKTPMKREKSFGMDCVPVIESEADAWFSNGMLRPKPAKPRKITIDRAAVRAAESDLETVTELMRVDEEETEVPAAKTEEPVPAGTSDDPWEDFASSLDDGERDYLRAALDGRPPRGRGSSRTEESVNDKASDTVGDVVMEDGEVFEEYGDDIRRVLG